MPIWIPDGAGLFKERPKYTAEELEAICDSAMSSILIARHGDSSRAVTNDDLTVCLEHIGAELELDSDLAYENEWRQAYTQFYADRPPIVRVARELVEGARYQNRFRFTLAHEGGHILAQREAYERRGNFLCGGSVWRRHCAKGGRTIAVHDWLEWQADYCGGALLMPLRLLNEYFGPPPNKDERAGRSVDSREGKCLIRLVSERFVTSTDAALERLVRVGYLRRPQQLGFRFGNV